MGVAPILAPTVGSVVVAHTSWRVIFGVLAGLAALTIAAVALGLRETLPAVRRSFHTYARLLRDRTFVGYALTSGLVLGAMFAYITGSPFVFTQLYGLSTQQYGLLFGLNASGLIAASQLNNWLLRHYAFPQILRGVTWVALLAGMALWGLARTGWRYPVRGGELRGLGFAQRHGRGPAVARRPRRQRGLPAGYAQLWLWHAGRRHDQRAGRWHGPADGAGRGRLRRAGLRAVSLAGRVGSRAGPRGELTSLSAAPFKPVRLRHSARSLEATR